MGDLDGLHNHIGAGVHLVPAKEQSEIEHNTENHKEAVHGSDPDSVELPFGRPEQSVLLLATGQRLASLLGRHFFADDGPSAQQPIVVLCIEIIEHQMQTNHPADRDQALKRVSTSK